jgi:hypothetical protein
MSAGLFTVVLLVLYHVPVFSLIELTKIANQVDESELRKAQTVLAKHETKLMSLSGVVGVGIGMSEAGDHVAIHVFVDMQSSAGMMPSSIPTRLDGVPVRIMNSDQIRSH